MQRELRACDDGPVFAGACPRSAQTLDGDSGNELGELPESVLIAGDDKVATERRRGDDSRFDQRTENLSASFPHLRMPDRRYGTSGGYLQ